MNGSLKIAVKRGALAPAYAQAFQVTGSRVTIRGLAIGGFGPAITFPQNSPTPITDIVIAGNYLGTTPDGLAAAPDSDAGIFRAGALEITVGGSTPAARNLISGHISAGVALGVGYTGRPANVIVRGNLIGTDATGQTAIPNDLGVAFYAAAGAQADVFRLGGDAPGDRNVISGNVNGVQISRGYDGDRDDSDNQMIGNFIGVAADGVTPLGNTNQGLGIRRTGQDTASRGTSIAHNGGIGVVIYAIADGDGQGSGSLREPYLLEPAPGDRSRRGSADAERRGRQRHAARTICRTFR